MLGSSPMFYDSEDPWFDNPVTFDLGGGADEDGASDGESDGGNPMVTVRVVRIPRTAARALMMASRTPAMATPMVRTTTVDAVAPKPRLTNPPRIDVSAVVS